MSMQLDNSNGIIKVAEKLKSQAICIEQLEAQLAELEYRHNSLKYLHENVTGGSAEDVEYEIDHFIMEVESHS